MNWNNIVVLVIIPIVCSMLASFMFWTFSFRIGTTKIVFSPELERSYRDGRYKIRIRVLNVGRGDLFDIKYMARLSIVPTMPNGSKGRRTYSYINMGQRSMAPVLFGKKYQMKHKDVVYSHTSILSETGGFYKLFSRPYNPDTIKKKAQEQSLTIDEVAEAYKDSFQIRIFAVGTDSITGVQKLFISKKYTNTDIITGHYQKPNVYLKRYKEYVKYVLSVEPKNKET